MSSAEAFLTSVRRSVDAFLEDALPRPDHDATRLAEAMRYSVFAGGKRLRPALAIAACRTLGGSDDVVMPFAGALELVHTYSLIHDDLPCMDDDDLRRGRPTSHKVFGEAMAVLAGDALQTLAFEVVLGATSDPRMARDLAFELASATGASGMAGGQAEDIEASGEAIDETSLLRIHARKTAALIRAACRGGARAAGADAETIDALGRYGKHLGLAFQAMDDVLDETGTAASLGKTPGKDRDEDRPTWVRLEGLEGARERCRREMTSALDALAGLDDRALLEDLAGFVTRRDH